MALSTQSPVSKGLFTLFLSPLEKTPATNFAFRGGQHTSVYFEHAKPYHYACGTDETCIEDFFKRMLQNY